MRNSLCIGEKKRCIVFVRDNFQCQDCGKHVEFYNPIKTWEKTKVFCDLLVHHINGPINDDYENLITLCSDCHEHKAHELGFKYLPTKFYTPKPLTEQHLKVTNEIFTATEYSKHGYLNIYNEYVKRETKLTEKWSERTW